MRDYEYFTPDERELNPCLGGRRTYFKGSSSKSSSSNSTSVTDRRTVGGEDALNLSTGTSTSGKNNRVTSNTVINLQDLSVDVVEAALDTVNVGVAENGEGFDKLLNLAGDLFSRGGELVQSSQQTAMAAVEAVNTAANDREGSIDQKTIIVLAVAGAAALFALNKG